MYFEDEVVRGFFLKKKNSLSDEEKKILIIQNELSKPKTSRLKFEHETQNNPREEICFTLSSF
jgi:hypothetical protein